MGSNSREFKRNAIPKVQSYSEVCAWPVLDNLLKRMQAKLKMEEKSSGIYVETSELDVLLEEVLERD